MKCLLTFSSQNLKFFFLSNNLKYVILILKPILNFQHTPPPRNIDYKKTYYKVNPLPVHTYLKTCKINKNMIELSRKSGIPTQRGI